MYSIPTEPHISLTDKKVLAFVKIWIYKNIFNDLHLDNWVTMAECYSQQ